MENIRNNIGERLKEYRKNNNLSVPDIEKMLGIPKDRIYKWEKGTVPYDSADYEKVEKLLIGKFGKYTEKHEKVNGFYYPDVNASAGLNFLTENSEIEKIPISIPNWGKGLDFINVFGDSMYPKFQSGEIIGIKKIEKEFIMYGYAYVVVLANGEVFLKYIKKGKDNNHVMLASENKAYEPKEFNLKNIHSIYHIKGVISKLTL